MGAALGLRGPFQRLLLPAGPKHLHRYLGSPQEPRLSQHGWRLPRPWAWLPYSWAERVRFTPASPEASEDSTPCPNRGSLDSGQEIHQDRGRGEGQGTLPKRRTAPEISRLTPRVALLPLSLWWPVEVGQAPPRLRPRPSRWPWPRPSRWLWGGRDSKAPQEPQCLVVRRRGHPPNILRAAGSGGCDPSGRWCGLGPGKLSVPLFPHL